MTCEQTNERILGIYTVFKALVVCARSCARVVFDFVIWKMTPARVRLHIRCVCSCGVFVLSLSLSLALSSPLCRALLLCCASGFGKKKKIHPKNAATNFSLRDRTTLTHNVHVKHMHQLPSTSATWTKHTSIAEMFHHYACCCRCCRRCVRTV